MSHQIKSAPVEGISLEIMVWSFTPLKKVTVSIQYPKSEMTQWEAEEERKELYSRLKAGQRV